MYRNKVKKSLVKVDAIQVEVLLPELVFDRGGSGIFNFVVQNLFPQLFLHHFSFLSDLRL
jgi:hypothetical protein